MTGASSPYGTSMTSATMHVTLSGPPPRRASSTSRSARLVRVRQLQGLQQCVSGETTSDSPSLQTR